MPNPYPNYADFVAEWSRPIRSMAVRSAFAGVDLEDVVENIIAELWMGDYLNAFDPALGSFSTYILGHARVRIAGAKRDFAKRGAREFIPVKRNEDDAAFDAADSQEEQNTEWVLSVSWINEALTETFTELNGLPKTKTKDLARLLSELVEQVAADGTCNHTAIAKKHGWSRQAISQQVGDLLRTPAMQALKARLQDSR